MVGTRELWDEKFGIDINRTKLIPNNIVRIGKERQGELPFEEDGITNSPPAPWWPLISASELCNQHHPIGQTTYTASTLLHHHIVPHKRRVQPGQIVVIHEQIVCNRTHRHTPSLN
uniref:Uncharacterized protein n=1 Tax=Plectus sambesii TaxID=2011161 RepID=A0A914WD11_9BILA